MASVQVSLADARDTKLPPVSVRSGEPADGYAPAGRPPYRIKVPLTQAEFDKVRALESRRRSSIRGGVGCVVLGAAMARFPVMLPLGVVIGVLSMAMWVLATLALKRMLPSVDRGSDPQAITLGRVHRRFAAAVREVGG